MSKQVKVVVQLQKLPPLGATHRQDRAAAVLLPEGHRVHQNHEIHLGEVNPVGAADLRVN